MRRDLAATKRAFVLILCSIAMIAIASAVRAQPTIAHDGIWLDQFSAPRPPVVASGSLAGLAFAHDSARDRLLQITADGQIWELPLGAPTWSKITTIAGPHPTDPMKAVYDPAGDQVWVLASTGGGSDQVEIWQLPLTEPLTWTLGPATGMFGRDGFSLILDAPRGRLVMFGGVTTPPFGGPLIYHSSVTTFPLDDPHAVALVTIGTPPGRFTHEALYDPIRQRMVVYGGSVAAGPTDEVWFLSLTTNTWTQSTTPGRPSLILASTLYDAPRDRMILVGSNGNVPTSEVWGLDFANPAWGQLIAPGDPYPRDDGAFLYDPVRDRGFLYGGQAFTDQWSLSLSGPPAWTPIIDPMPPPTYDMSLIYDSGGRQMVVYGGVATRADDVWCLSGGEDPQWVRRAPTGPIPPRRRRHSAVYDAPHHRMVVIGGQTDNFQLLNDAWQLDLDATSWSPIVPTGALPKRRLGPSTIYDPIRNRLVVFGGSDSVNVFMNDLWQLDLNGSPHWTQLAPSGAPPSPRRFACTVYDASRDRLLVHGGQTSPSGDVATYALALGVDPPAWSAVGTTGMPPPTTSSTNLALYDPAADRILVMIDQFAGGTVSELTLSGSPQWRLLSPAGTAPHGRFGAQWAYDPDLDRAVFFGGGAKNDTYVLAFGGRVDAPFRLPPATIRLRQPFPNPSRGAFEIPFDLPRAGAASLAIYDAAGRRVRSLLGGRVDAGERVAQWDAIGPGGRRVAAGLYFAVLSFEGARVTRRMLVVD